MSPATLSRLDEIAQAVRDYLVSVTAALPVIIDSVTADKFNVDAIDTLGHKPRLYVTGMEVEQELAERDDHSFIYSVEVQVIWPGKQQSTAQRLENSLLVEAVKTQLTNRDQAGADFLTMADETPVEELLEAELEAGGYLRTVIPLEYFEIK